MNEYRNTTACFAEQQQHKTQTQLVVPPLSPQLQAKWIVGTLLEQVALEECLAYLPALLVCGDVDSFNCSFELSFEAANLAGE